MKRFPSITSLCRHESLGLGTASIDLHHAILDTQLSDNETTLCQVFHAYKEVLNDFPQADTTILETLAYNPKTPRSIIKMFTADFLNQFCF